MERLEERVALLLGESVRSIRPVGGGCIAGASELMTSGGRYFLKRGTGAVGHALEAEADGLAVLGGAVAPDGLHVPAVVAFDASDPGELTLLVLEWIDAVAFSVAHWDQLGRGLAALHAVEAPAYGHGRDNWIGRKPQVNTPHDRWADFFRECRLMPQVAMAREAGRWDASWDSPYRRLCERLDDILPETPPASVLHGDLWIGNVLACASGRSAVVDPAVYAGDRESDLAMARLFGGFSDRFFEAYGEAWPLEPGWEEREPVYALYHLVNHLNHFGGSYARGVNATLQALGRSPRNR